MNKHENQKEEMTNLLTKFKNDELKMDELVDRLLLKTQLPNKPYFRTTKSRAIALYGIKRDPLVLYKHQWMRLSRVFTGGKECTFNKFFFNEELHVKNQQPEQTEEVEQEEEVNEFLKDDEMDKFLGCP